MYCFLFLWTNWSASDKIMVETLHQKLYSITKSNGGIEYKDKKSISTKKEYWIKYKENIGWARQILLCWLIKKYVSILKVNAFRNIFKILILKRIEFKSSTIWKEKVLLNKFDEA